MADTILGALWAANAPRRAHKFARVRIAAFGARTQLKRSRRVSSVVMRPTPRRSNEFNLRTWP